MSDRLIPTHIQINNEQNTQITNDNNTPSEANVNWYFLSFRDSVALDLPWYLNHVVI